MGNPRADIEKSRTSAAQCTWLEKQAKGTISSDHKSMGFSGRFEVLLQRPSELVIDWVRRSVFDWKILYPNS